MSTVTLNGRIIDRATDFTLLKNGELNWLLGTDGRPKYSDGQMKNLPKYKLADELRDLVASIPETRAKATREGVGRGNSRQPSVSKTKAVAQSKKCNILKALAAGKTTPERIREILDVDHVLRDYWKTAEADIVLAQSGIRPKGRQQETVGEAIASAVEEVAGIDSAERVLEAVAVGLEEELEEQEA